MKGGDGVWAKPRKDTAFISLLPHHASRESSAAGVRRVLIFLPACSLLCSPGCGGFWLQKESALVRV